MQVQRLRLLLVLSVLTILATSSCVQAQTNSSISNIIGSITERVESAFKEVQENLDQTLDKLIDGLSNMTDMQRINSCYDSSVGANGNSSQSLDIFNGSLNFKSLVTTYYNAFSSKNFSGTNLLNLLNSTREMVSSCSDPNRGNSSMKYGFTSLSDMSADQLQSLLGLRTDVDVDEDEDDEDEDDRVSRDGRGRGGGGGRGGRGWGSDEDEDDRSRGRSDEDEDDRDGRGGRGRGRGSDEDEDDRSRGRSDEDEDDFDRYQNQNKNQKNQNKNQNKSQFKRRKRLTGNDQRCIAQVQNMPSEYDWRNKSVVTPVRNQQDCGSCWTFASLAALESALLINNQTDKSVDDLSLSEQHLIQCATQNSFYGTGCDGGTAYWAYKHIKKSGVPHASQMPYKARNGFCPFFSSYSNKVTIDNYCIRSKQQYTRNSVSEQITEDDIAQSLVHYGPLYIAIYADPLKSRNYRGGVFDVPDCNGDINHAVTLVGFTQDAWIIKNSWGPDWGEDGYFRLARGKNMCNVNTEIAWPLLSNSTNNSNNDSNDDNGGSGGSGGGGWFM